MSKNAFHALFSLTLVLLFQNGFSAPLGDAIINRSIRDVKICVRRGDTINYIDEFLGASPLCCAAKNGDLEIVTYLLVNGAQITERVIKETDQQLLRTLLQVVDEFNQSHDKHLTAIEEVRDGGNLFLSILIGRDIRNILSQNFRLQDLFLYKLYHEAKKQVDDVENIVQELNKLHIKIKVSDFYSMSFSKFLLSLFEKIASVKKNKNYFAHADQAYKILEKYIQKGLAKPATLREAAKNGDFEAATYLLVNGANITKEIIQETGHHFLKMFLQEVYEFSQSNGKHAEAIVKAKEDDNFYLSMVIGEDIRTIISRSFALKSLHLYKLFYATKQNREDATCILQALKELGINIEKKELPGSQKDNFYGMNFPEFLFSLMKKITEIPEEKNGFTHANLAYEVLDRYMCVPINRDIHTILSQNFELKKLNLCRIYNNAKESAENEKRVLLKLEKLGISLDEIGFHCMDFPEFLCALLGKIAEIPADKSLFTHAAQARQIILQRRKQQKAKILPYIPKLEDIEPFFADETPVTVESETAKPGSTSPDEAPAQAKQPTGTKQPIKIETKKIKKSRKRLSGRFILELLSRPFRKTKIYPTPPTPTDQTNQTNQK